MLHTIFLYTHILSAIISIGPLVSLLPILHKMEKSEEDEMKAYVLAFKTAISVVKHAGHVLVLSGALLIFVSGWTWTTSWVVLTIALMILSIVFLARAFKPTLIMFGTPNYEKNDFIQKLRKATWKYIILLLLMLWFMVAKPMLW